jgi:hypothetical protein
MQLYQLNNNLTTQLIFDHATLSTQQQLDNLNIMKLLDMQMHVVPINNKMSIIGSSTLMSTKAAGPKAPNFNEHKGCRA